VSGPRAKVLTAVCCLLVIGLGALAVATPPTLSAGSPRPLVAAGPDGDTYPQMNGQKHFGGRCTPDSTAIAGGAIVEVGGQEAAGGGGTGVGCDTFYAYELGGGPPKIDRPHVVPGLYLNPGGAIQPRSLWL
jgi:hypothetical protein